MATDCVDAQIRCPACNTLLTIRARARYNGDGTATVTIDTMPVQQHADEHHQRSSERCGEWFPGFIPYQSGSGLYQNCILPPNHHDDHVNGEGTRWPVVE